VLDAGERIGGVLLDAAADALEVGVRGALGSLLGRAADAASHAAESLKSTKRKVDGRD
jgi:hypothetical protein